MDLEPRQGEAAQQRTGTFRDHSNPSGGVIGTTLLGPIGPSLGGQAPLGALLEHSTIPSVASEHTLHQAQTSSTNPQPTLRITRTLSLPEATVPYEPAQNHYSGED